VEFVAPDPPRFVRDSINIDDLDRARPKIMLPPDLVERDVFKVNEIEGTSPKKQYKRGTQHDSFNYHDVTRDVWKTSRTGNPLEPSYVVRDSGDGFRAATGGANAEYGTINGSKPTLARGAQTAPKALHTLDIVGA
jgi:hypothetical protein